MAQVRNLHIYSVLKPRKSRTKSGCQACRARRKKCDEQKPICRSCQRLQSSCSWPISHGTQNTVLESSSVSESSKTQSAQSTVVPETSSVLQADPYNGQEDELDSSGSPTEALLTELRELGQQLRECGIFPYSKSVAPEIRDRILASRGPETAMLFDHFCYETTPWLINGECHDSPVLRYIVPLTVTDDLVLQTVLAISGTHLHSTMPSIASLALKYYAHALATLRKRISEWLHDSNKDYKPLFIATILLCHCEFIQGNTHGAALQHLRACREFVDVAIQNLNQPGHHHLAVFLIEHYGYFVLISNLRGSLLEDNIRLGHEFSTSIVPSIKDSPSFGTVLSFEPESFYLIPQIAQLALHRKQSAHLPNSQLHQDVYKVLLDKINNERVEVGFSGDKQLSDLATWDERQLAIAIKIDILLMYLHASYYECKKSAAWISALLHPLVDSTMVLLTHIDEVEACYGLFWSFLVMGSYIRNQETQQLLVRQIQTNQSKMPFMKRGTELLQWLWNENENVNFGLTGLERVANAHGVGLCIC